MRNVTLKQFIQAIRKNGYKQGFGTYIQYDHDDYEGEVEFACAIGQAGLNLKVLPSDLHNYYLNLGKTHNDQPDIVDMNDRMHLSLDAIANIAEEWARKNKIYTKHMGKMREMGED